jgi:hypothetical protein
VLVVGVVPFAAAAAWTVVLPITALLMLVLGIPLVHGTAPRDPARATNR